MSNRLNNSYILPRLLRLRDVPIYLGMDRNRFNSEVRPFLTEIPIGEQGIAFDRLDLDAWVEDYKSCNGRPGKLNGEIIWDAKKHLDSSNVMGSGTLTKGSKDMAEFAKALERVRLEKQKTF